MFKIVPNRNVGFTLPGGLTVVLKHLKKKSRKTLKVLFIIAGLTPFLFTKPATAQVMTAVPQTVAVPAATQTTTDETTQKRIEELIAQLGDKNWRVRQSAANALGEIGDPQAVQGLIKTLEDESWNVRISAVHALYKIGDPQAVQPLIKALSDRDYGVRISTALGKIGQPAVQPLIKALEDENWFVRKSAASALGQIGDPQAVQPLIKALEDENSSVRLWATEALGRIGDPQAVQSLIKALEDENETVREHAATALGKIDDPQAKKVVRKRASARKAREVQFVLIKLLTPFLPIFLFVGLGLVLKYKGYITANVARAISIYPTLVIGNVICPLKFTILGLAYSSFGLWTLGGRWLSITTGGFLVLVYEYDLGGPYGHKEMYYLLSLAYSAVFFLPLFGHLFFKKRIAKITCALVQVVFIICHAAVIYILITRYDLVNRMIDVIRY